MSRPCTGVNRYIIINGWPKWTMALAQIGNNLALTVMPFGVEFRLCVGVSAKVQLGYFQDSEKFMCKRNLIVACHQVSYQV